MSKINCILHGSFEDKLPTDTADNSTIIEVTNITQLLSHFDIDPDYVQYVISNGKYIEEEDWDTPLADEATIRVWPRLAGG